MKGMNLEFPRLTDNDRQVLKKILEYRKIPDSDIARTINLTPQAVFKIRNKLESSGIIKGYMPIVDFGKLGITVMVVLVVSLTSKVWKTFTDDQISEIISKTSYVIEAFRVSDEQASHIMIMGFRNIAQKEFYISQIQTKFADEIHIRAMYTFSIDKVISQNPLGLLHEIIDQKEFTPNDLFLSKVFRK
jgi:DNA-binding Lrp family transcriptional regulator